MTCFYYPRYTFNLSKNYPAKYSRQQKKEAIMITCSNCKTEYPEYIGSCTKCGTDPKQEKRGSDPNEQCHRVKHNNSINPFNLSFDPFITPQLIKLIFGFVVVVGAVITLFGIVAILTVSNFNTSLKVMFSFGCIILYVFEICLVRMGCELSLVLFKIERNTRHQ